MSYPVDGFRNQARATGTVDGLTAVKLASTMTNRGAYEIHNADPARYLWVVEATKGSTAPTITSANKDYQIPPGGTVHRNMGIWFDVYILNDSGAAISSNYVFKEMA